MVGSVGGFGPDTHTAHLLCARRRYKLHTINVCFASGTGQGPRRRRSESSPGGAGREPRWPRLGRTSRGLRLTWACSKGSEGP